MDYFVDNNPLLPVIIFGDFSKEELSQFFRVKATRSPVVSKGDSKMADDNPFSPLAQKDSNDSLVEHVDSLNLASSTSFPALPSTSGSGQMVNRNQNNDGDDQNKKSSNPFQPVAMQQQASQDPSPMDHDSTEAVSSTNLSYINSRTSDQTDSNGLFITPTTSASKFNFTGSGASPSASKRLVRSSTRAQTLSHSGVILRSSKVQKNSKNKVQDQDPKLKQNLENMFTLTDMDLSQLVATQSDTTGLKLTIRRKEVTSTRSSIDLQGPRLQNPDNTSGHSGLRDPANVCLQKQNLVAPLPQRTNQKARSRSTSTPEPTSGVSAAQTHVDSRRSATSDSSSHVDLHDSVFSGTVVGGSKQTNTGKQKQKQSDDVILLSSTPNSNILNKRLPSQHSSTSLDDNISNHSEIISTHLGIIKQATERNAFTNLNHKDPNQDPNFSQDLVITATDNSRKISKKNNVNPPSAQNAQKNGRELLKDWTIYQQSINNNPFSQIQQKSNDSSSPPTRNPVRFQTNSVHSISTQGNNAAGVFKQAAPVLDEYKVTLSKELTLKLHVQMLESQLQYRWYPNWCVTYKPPPTLINSEDKVRNLIEIREKLARTMLETNLQFYKELHSEMEAINASSVESLEAMYKTGHGKAYSLENALEKCRIHANDQREKKLDELTKIMTAIGQAPLAALWQGVPEQYERPSGATRVPPPHRVEAGPSSKNTFKKNKNNKLNKNNRARPTTRPSGPPQRDRSASRGNNYNKRRRDEISRYVAQAVEKTVKGMVQDFM